MAATATSTATATATSTSTSTPTSTTTPTPTSTPTDRLDAIRGITIGPIENALHPNVGYGSRAYDRTLVECRQMGATWVAITPFGRVMNLDGRGVDPTFEAPFEKNKADVARAIAMAHARGLKVMLVPHLWVESGEWRALIDPKTDEGWDAWAKSYASFVLGWAEIAEKAHAEMLSVGVELRSWVTTTRAPSFLEIIRKIRATYKGLLTYSANWDDVSDTVILGAIDVIGINAFYPLADKDGAGLDELVAGGARVRDKLRALSDAWQKPIMFTEIGYTTRPNPAVKPWEWPDAMKGVKVDQVAQAEAYHALISPFRDEPWFLGFFVWRVYADPDDVSQEAEWGFSPRGKLSELVVRDAFASRFAHDRSPTVPGFPLAAQEPGFFP
jgi:hypothetical protein